MLFFLTKKKDRAKRIVESNSENRQYSQNAFITKACRYRKYKDKINPKRATINIILFEITSFLNMFKKESANKTKKKKTPNKERGIPKTFE